MHDPDLAEKSAETPAGRALVARVRAELRRAGFVDAPASDIEGGLTVRHEADRGVVVCWTTAAEVIVKNRAAHHQVRAAVNLALMAILTGVGYTAAADHATGEVIVTGGPDTGDGAPGRRRPTGVDAGA
ncbi:hypothetical protein Ppa06_70460 [Planomonospora parontospora subsp. parontospora]|uniref:Uncharacterized protein n=2 Tax=Planomonospora parontospora TaxID=58119 RepID=A0AA37BNE1_9ACTN|nr:hypothetical protein [Planomonospora parontospora]GGK94413.1 hypothetical protein GCM10010126_62360 [Planomonospora parontospora]GII13248.1 hypothetical protein Ppa06_70460 [Planomonospora parontospora subsp. parontospora]